uniref:Uncharacterized protein n=1 Tax=Brassica oleracea TaxID=3712 RepID=A0A3P6DXZ9_BRAOL|nr:unnamed protein product [Brassica oleracea]
MAGDVGETNDKFFKSGEAAVDQEDKIVVPPRKEPEVEKKTKPEHEHDSYHSKATFVAYKQYSGNKMDKVNEILSLAYIDVFFIMKCFMLLLYYRFWLLI